MTHAAFVNLGKYIRERREAKGLSMSTLVRRTGVAWPTLNKWEKHGAIPEAANLTKIADALEMTAAERTMLFSLAALREVAEPSPAKPQPVEPRADAAAAALDDRLTRCLPNSHARMTDASALFRVLEEAAADLSVTDETLTHWLDVAAELRAAGRKITALSMLVAAGRSAAAPESKVIETGHIGRRPKRARSEADAALMPQKRRAT